MANRKAKVASAIAGIVAGGAITILASGSARAADECLTEPRTETPQGQHWYYRLEHTTKRHCWYLRDEGAKPALAASPASGDEPSPTTETAAGRSIADARDELPPPRAQDGRASATRRTSTSMPAAALPQDNQGLQNQGPDAVTGANTSGNAASGSPVVARWPDPSEINSSASAAPQAPATVVADAGATPQAQPAPAAPAAEAPAPKATGSLQMLLLVVFGALALAGLVGSLVFRLGRPRQVAQTAARRRDIWATTESPPRPPWVDMPPENLATRAARAPRPDFAHTATPPGAQDDSVERIEEFLARLSRLAQGDMQSPPSR